jgi:hypothetical protein
MTINAEWIAIASLSSLLASPAIAANLQEPQQIATSLQRFAHDFGDMQRRLQAQAYERIPHEDEDFSRDAAALRIAIAGEPADFKRATENAMANTLQASSRVAHVSDTRDADQVQRALVDLADAIHQLNALFPAALRSEVSGETLGKSEAPAQR